MGNQRSKILKSLQMEPETIDQSHLVKLFQEHDTDKDGFLSRDEVHIFLRDFAKQIGNNVDVDQFFQEFNLKKDAKFGISELIGHDHESSIPTLRASSKKYPFVYATSPSRELRDFADQFDNYIIDCDGVLWKSGDLIPGSKETIARLRKAGKKLIFCTNSSTKSRAEYKLKFDQVGIPVDENEILPSTYAAAMLLKKRFPHVRKAYVIGTSGLRDELQLVGIEAVAASAMHPMTESDFSKIQTDKSIQAVVGGFDASLTYGKLCMAGLYVEHNKCPMVVTSQDGFDQLNDRRLLATPIILKECVERITGRKAHVAGKPSQFLIDELLKMQGWNPNKTVMIGDRLDSDMLFAGRGGVAKLLVLSGCFEEKDLPKIQPGATDCPDFVLPRFGLINDSYKISRL